MQASVGLDPNQEQMARTVWGEISQALSKLRQERAELLAKMGPLDVNSMAEQFGASSHPTTRSVSHMGHGQMNHLILRLPKSSVRFWTGIRNILESVTGSALVVVIGCVRKLSHGRRKHRPDACRGARGIVICCLLVVSISQLTDQDPQPKPVPRCRVSALDLMEQSTIYVCF